MLLKPPREQPNIKASIGCAAAMDVHPCKRSANLSQAMGDARRVKSAAPKLELGVGGVTCKLILSSRQLDFHLARKADRELAEKKSYP